MKLKLFTIKDLITSEHNTLFTALNEGVARRSVRDVTANSSHPTSKYPNDFELWEVGEYDSDTGVAVANVSRRVGSIAQIVPQLQGYQRDAGAL